jgi:mRNA interferase MazF
VSVSKWDRGNIFYADLSPVVGSEQGGVRPVLIVQNNIGNKYSPTVVIVPITSFKEKHKHKAPYNVEIKMPDKDVICIVEANHIRTIDKKRFDQHRGKLTDEEMRRVDKAICDNLAISYEEMKEGAPVVEQCDYRA